MAEIAARKHKRMPSVPGKRLLKPVLRIGANQEREVLAKLATFVEELGIELLTPQAGAPSTPAKESVSE